MSFRFHFVPSHKFVPKYIEIKLTIYDFFPIVFITDNNTNELTNHLRFGEPIKRHTQTPTHTKYAQLGYNAAERQL